METHTFRLADGADEAAFLVADRLVQETFSAYRNGFVRRTTARGADGEWMVVTLWATAADAETSDSLPEFDDLITGSEIRRYETLD